jgi:hypothetical protein
MTSDEASRISFFAMRLNPYHRLAIIAVSEERGAQALQWAERARSRAFLDLLSRAEHAPDVVLERKDLKTLFA